MPEMRALGLLLLPMMALAQAPGPSGAAAGLVRGVLLERDSQDATGELSVRAADNQVFRYRFDRKTYVEREDRSIDVAHLRTGERVEVLSDVISGTPLRYARTIHVLLAPAPARPLSLGRLRYRSSAEQAIPTGTLTFSGVVFRLNGERLVMHTREAGDQSILLRQDTRYLDNGEVVDAAALQTNMRVFVRAGKNLYDEVEAYQVIWGRILEAR